MSGDPWVGREVSGCRIERLLGRGGMGAVYLARRERDGLPVVVKVLAPELAHHADLRARFEREALALQKLPPHPHVVRVHAVALGAQPHLVMEYVDGPALSRAIAERGRLAPADAARIAKEVALALGALHARGVLHRDVKPANVLLDPGGRARLVDLGLAKDVFSSGLTEPGQLLGTVHYMAPEQWNEQPLDPRCDVFALGATLYHALVGRPPFPGQDAAEVADLATAGEYAPPRALAPEVPPALEEVVHLCLAPEQDRRYPDARACAEDLARVLRGLPARGPALASGAVRFALLPGTTYTLGSGAGCELRLHGPAIAERHAQLRRKAEGYVLKDLQSPGTFVEGEPVRAPRALRDGDRVRVGQVELRFEEPLRRPPPPPLTAEVRREVAPAPVVEALAALADGRALAALLERLAPDPLADARAERALTLAAGPAVAREALARRAQLLAERRARAHEALSAIAGRAPGAATTPEAWLAWWLTARPDYPVQLGAARPPGGLRLQADGELERVLEPEGGGESPWGVVQLGRDPGRHLALPHPSIAPLHASLVRLHERVLLVDEGGGVRVGERAVALALLGPGEVVQLGALRVSLAVPPGALEPVPCALGLLALDLPAFLALADLGHPAVLSALARAAAGPPAELVGGGARLFPGDAARAAAFDGRVAGAYAELAARARRLLPAALPRVEPARWLASLTARRGELPPQVAPTGWPLD